MRVILFEVKHLAAVGSVRHRLAFSDWSNIVRHMIRTSKIEHAGSLRSEGKPTRKAPQKKTMTRNENVVICLRQMRLGLTHLCFVSGIQSQPAPRHHQWTICFAEDNSWKELCPTKVTVSSNGKTKQLNHPNLLVLTQHVCEPCNYEHFTHEEYLTGSTDNRQILHSCTIIHN